MIDITNLTSLITAFRNETEQGSISPETLGSLLQAIANLLSAASTDQEQIKLTNIYDNLLKMGNCLTNLAQGDADRNNVLADYAFFNPISGLHSAQRSQILIKQATTERAGAMRAQQVIDLNATKKGVATLEEAVATINSQLEELNGYLESLDSVVQANADNISSLTDDFSSFNSRLGYVPFHQGNIVIDASSITSPITNYFKFNMPDGHYNLIRGGQRIGQLYTYMYNNFRVFDIVGLCYISSTSFIYHDRFDHILVRMNYNGQIFVTGSILTTDLQNQINLKQDQLEAGTGIQLEGNKISVDFVPDTTYTLEFSASDGVFSGSFEETEYNALRQAIIDGKTIVVLGGVTRTTAVSTALADDYLMIRYCVPRIQSDNATVTLSVYELKVSASSFTSKSIHKVLSAA